MTQATVLVVGGAGYIGSHVVRTLADRGHRPITLDNLSTGHRDAVQSGVFEYGDLGDPARLRAVLRKHRCDAVMHFAACAYVGESVTDPAKYWQNNVAAPLVLLDAVRDAGISAFLFSSTCATYGEPQQLPIPEGHPQAPVNPYGHTKRALEQVLFDYDRAYGLRHVILRYFNAAGAHPDGTLGERHDPETHLIPLLFDAVRARRPIKVFGDDYPTPDGTCIRDYIHICDLADAHVAGMERLLAGQPSAIYNLGNGQGYSVREVIACVQQVTGQPVPWEIAPRRAGDPAVLVGSAEKARAELAWNPQFPRLQEIVATAWTYYRRQHGLSA